MRQVLIVIEVYIWLKSLDDRNIQLRHILKECKVLFATGHVPTSRHYNTHNTNGLEDLAETAYGRNAARVAS